MKRIYGNPAFTRRMNLSTAVVVFAIFFGFFELWSVLRAAPEDRGYGFLFATLFIGGGAYAIWQMLTDYADMVVALDADDVSGRAVVAVWRPFASKRIEGGIDSLRDWRFETTTGRGGVRMDMLLADHPGHKRPLKFELDRKIPLSGELRALAPEAVAEFERKL